jgi:hypothetical protein
MKISTTPKRHIPKIVSTILAITALVFTSIPLSPTAHAASSSPLPHAPLPAYIHNYPKPTITLNTADGASDLAPWMTESVIPLLRDWYPVIGDKIIGGGYVCFPEKPCDRYPLVGSFTLKANTSLPPSTAMRMISSTVIEFNPTLLRANQPSAYGMFIHELVHMAQQSQSAPYWFNEGTADYFRIHVYKDYNPAINPNASYLNGYSTAGHFINYIDNLYPRYVEKMSLATHGKGIYTPSYTTKLTGGVTIETLWKNYSGHSISTIVNMKPGNAPTRCIDLPGYATADGTRPDIWDCVPQENVRWVARDQDTPTGGVIQAYYGVKCLSVNKAIASSGGYGVDYRPCNTLDVNQKFLRRADATVYNAATNRCLRPVAAAAINGTKLEVVACNATQTAQKWTWSLAI